VSLILPNRAVLDVMVEQHLEAAGTPFPWWYILLEDLGVSVDHDLIADA
jgi:hypothetical protein